MFGRGKRTQFEITEHPDVIAALNAMAEEWYRRGRQDALAIVKDFADEYAATASVSDINMVNEVIEALES